MSQNFEQTTHWDARQVRSRTQQRGSASGAAAKKKKPGQGQRIGLYILCVLVISAILAEVGWLLANDLCAFNKEYKEATVEIVKSDDLGDVTNKLKDSGLIQYKWLFRLFGGLVKAESKIGVGSYKLNTNMDYKALIRSMHNSSAALTADTVKVPIPEGFTVAETIQRLADYGVNTVENLTEAAKNYKFNFTFIDNENLGELKRLEGYLFPDTYEFYVNEDSTKALSRIIENFQNRVNSEVLAEIEESGRSLRDTLIIASLIEKETDGKDQAKIASVIANRMKNPGYETAGLLQIDASKLYSDDPAYDLYLNPGLPPTPIANPGLVAIQAAIHPANTDYYYYALGVDGTHHYFKTYNEHLNFINSDKYAGSGSSKE